MYLSISLTVHFDCSILCTLYNFSWLHSPPLFVLISIRLTFLPLLTSLTSIAYYLLYSSSCLCHVSRTLAIFLLFRQTGCYATMQQQFSQFPAQEYAWNLADEILLGNMNVDTSSNNRWDGWLDSTWQLAVMMMSMLTYRLCDNSCVWCIKKNRWRKDGSRGNSMLYFRYSIISYYL